MVTMVSQQLCGISPGELARRDPLHSSSSLVMFFSTRVLEPVFKGSSKTIAVLIIIPKIPLTLLPAFLIKVRLTFKTHISRELIRAQRFGTKKIILQTTLLMGLSSLCLAMGINQDAPALSITGMTTFVSAFSVGLGPLGWTTLSEVLPPHARTAAGSLAVGLNWTTQFIMVRRLSFRSRLSILCFKRAKADSILREQLSYRCKSGCRLGRKMERGISSLFSLQTAVWSILGSH